MADRYETQVSLTQGTVLKDANGDPDPQRGTDGAGHVRSQTTGTYISKQTLTLSATSQALTVPATATSVLIQVHGGTVTDPTYINLGGTATTADFVLHNVDDAYSNSEILISGDLTVIELLGTANASVAVMWYFL